MSDRSAPAVLFVCTGNTCRSPMAEYELAHRAAARGLRVAAFSRATALRGGDISKHTLTVLEEAGVPVDEARKHEPTQVTAEDVRRAFRIYCVTDRHRDALLQLCPEAREKTELVIPGEDIPDPYGGDLGAYRACAEKMGPAVGVIVDSLVAELGTPSNSAMRGA